MQITKKNTKIEVKICKSHQKKSRRKYVSMVYFQQRFPSMMWCPIYKDPEEDSLPGLHFFRERANFSVNDVTVLIPLFSVITGKVKHSP